MVLGRARVAPIGWKWGHELADNLPEVAANLPLQRHFRGKLRVFCRCFAAPAAISRQVGILDCDCDDVE